MIRVTAEPGHMIGESDAELRALARDHGLMRPVMHPRLQRPAAPVYLPPLEGAPPKVIKARVGRTVVFFLFDDSGSMYGRYGDPLGVRYAVGQSVTGLMSRSGGGRAGAIHWGTHAPMEMVLRPVDVRKGKKALKAAMVVPPTLGGNDLPLALRRAAEITPPLARDEMPFYYVITDGGESVTPAMHAAILALPPRSIHVLLVDNYGICNDAMAAAWATCAFGSWTRLETFDTEQMATQIAEIFAGSIGLQMPDSALTKETKP
jgi:hypothetical protein